MDGVLSWFVARNGDAMYLLGGERRGSFLSLEKGIDEHNRKKQLNIVEKGRKWRKKSLTKSFLM